MKKFATFCFTLMFVLAVATGCPLQKQIGSDNKKPAASADAGSNKAKTTAPDKQQAKDPHGHGGAAATTEETK